jgi:predicted adenylyl cyclase CyaB
LAKNIEIKARVGDMTALHANAKRLAAMPAERIPQDDTFFNCTNGRLKLREFSAQQGELIFYQRENKLGPKQSFYLRTLTTEPAVMRETLSLAYGVFGRVVKTRSLYHIGRTRVHLDEVVGLGNFMELEVVLATGEVEDAGVIEARQLMEELSIDPSQLVEYAYIDLLMARHS